jgi:hypothetical protein
LRARVHIPFLFVYLTGAALLSAQAPAPARRVVGEVQSATASQVVLKTDSGETVNVNVDPATVYWRVPPGETDLKKAEKITAADVSTGDRVLARPRPGTDIASAPAGTIVVMSKSDLAKKHEADRAEWQKRGLSGTVTAVDPAKKELTVNLRTREGLKLVIIDASGKTSFKRYAPDSVKFADAKPSSFEEIKAGDQVRVLGERNEDGTQMRAEAVVSGTFRNLAGTVVSVGTSGDEVSIKDLDSKKTVVIKVNPDTMVRRLPPMMAQGIAMRAQNRAQGGGAPGGGAPGAQGAPGGNWQGGGNWQRPGGAAPGGPGGPGGTGGWQGGGGRAGNGDSQQMLERLPAMPVSDLKPGDAVIVAGPAGTDPGRLSAIALVAGVEPILTAPRTTGPEAMGGSWNLDINIIQ